MKHIAISGGFDPIHVGHLRYIQAAALLGKVTVILNGDSFLLRKKGYRVFPSVEREELLRGIRGVDNVFVWDSDEDTVCGALRIVKPDIFAKGGDRGPGNVPEEDICKELGIEIVYGVGGSDKPNSSSWAIENIWKQRILRDRC